MNDLSHRVNGELHERVLASSASPCFITDEHRRIVWTNPAFASATGYAAEEAAGRDPAFLSSVPPGAARSAAMWATVARDGHWEGEASCRRKSGDVFAAGMSLGAVRDAQGRTTHYFGVLTDITERKREEAQLRRLAQHYALTTLPNRAVFEDRLKQATAAAARNHAVLGVLFIDLDRFKAVNDSFGHAAGDKVLRASGERLEGCVRESDSVARWGGDEFVVLLVDAHGLSAIYRIAQKIRAALQRPHEVGGHQVLVTASIGIATFPDDALQPEALVDKADAAMYAAKRHGPGGVHFHTIGHRSTPSQGAGTHLGRVRLAAVSRRPSSIGEST